MNTPSSASDDHLLLNEIDRLASLLDEAIGRLGSSGLLQEVLQIRRWALARRQGDPEAGRRLLEFFRTQPLEKLREFCQAFTCYFDLANLAEDRHRVRTLQARRQAGTVQPDSLEQTLGRFESADQAREVLQHLCVELVITAHPTETRRMSVRRILDELHRSLDRDAGVESLEQSRAMIQALWETDRVRESPPEVWDEVRRGARAADAACQALPSIRRRIRQALHERFPDETKDWPTVLRFASWIGGDRDGHPGVTARLTEQTLLFGRQRIVRRHLQTLERVWNLAGLSATLHHPDPGFLKQVRNLPARIPAIRDELERTGHGAVYRQWLVVIRHRLQGLLSTETLIEPYAQSGELADDIARMDQSLRHGGQEALARQLLTPWLDEVNLFGLWFLPLDVREHSGRIEQVAAELRRAMDRAGGVDEQTRARAIDPTALSPESRETLATFELIQDYAHRYAGEPFRALVLSMTHRAGQWLDALELCRLASYRAGHGGDVAALPIVPLFETIDDLERGGELIGSLLENAGFRHHVERCGGRVQMMLGYSDSTKDGGYASANWHLYHAQQLLAGRVQCAGYEPVFFHGRGGALGRGGGPAARGLRALPPGTFCGHIRITEQGEVLSERYDNPLIAERHLEQVVGAAIGNLLPHSADASDWPERVMRRIARRSRKAYRRLVDHPEFGSLLQQATPIQVISQLGIGSRPSSRKRAGSWQDMRAIPFTFAWHQSRTLLTAWYGLADGMEPWWKRTPRLLQDLYRHWPFFQVMIDNAALALAKTDADIAGHYLELAAGEGAAAMTAESFRRETERTRDLILKITGEKSLLARTPWLTRSIDRRNPSIDPLNFIQIELLRRREKARDDRELSDIDQALRLSIHGIACGLRATG